MSLRESPISILEYSDYRLFLKDAYGWLHARNRNFSYRLIASKAGSASSGWFGDVLKGRQNLSGTQMMKLSALFKLNEKETEYFEVLIRFNQSGSLEEKNRYYRGLIALRGPKSKLVGQDQFEYYSKWYYAAIRELLFFYEYRGDEHALARKLNPAIKPAEAREAIQLLIGLRFIRKDAQGRYRPAEDTLKKDPAIKSLLAVNYLKTNMELGISALELFSKDERHISAMTLSFSEPFRAKAVAEIEALRNKLVALMDEDPNPDKVYQMNLQLFPLSL